MLSSIIKVKLEKNCCPFEKLENFLAKGVFHIDDRKGFKDSLVELVIEHEYDKTLTLTLPREAIPNSFALQLLSSLYKENALALPVILKYLAHRDLFKDFDEISKKLQAKMDQDIQVQNNSKISKEIEVCKQDILNVLSGGKSVLSDQLKQKYYPILKNEVAKLKAEISKELEDYINDNNTNIHKMYQSLNSKIKKTMHYNEIGSLAVFTSIAFLFSLLFAPVIALAIVRLGGRGFLRVFMYTATPFLVVATLALIIAGVAYLIKRHYEQSFVKEMQDFIEGSEYVDKATNTEDVKKLEQEETEVGDLIDLSDNYGMNYKGEP